MPKPFDITAPLINDSAQKIDENFNDIYDALEAGEGITATNGETIGIQKGDAVRLVGGDGLLPVIKLAKADADSTMPAIGLAADSIAPQQSGIVQAIFTILDGLNTSTFALDDTLYVSDSTAGALTATKPSDRAQVMGTVIGVNPTQGRILVCVEAPTQSGVIKADGTVPLTANWDAGSFEIRAETFESDVTTGTAPLVVASTTKVTNLNADTLDGINSDGFVKVDGSVPMTADWNTTNFNIFASRLRSAIATGTSPFTVASTTVTTNLNADLLDGNHASAFGDVSVSGTPTADQIAIWTDADTIKGIGKHTEPTTGSLVLGTGADGAGMTGVSNTLAGINAGAAITTGARNLCMGLDAGLVIDAGDQNVCLGQLAGSKITSGDNNMCIGREAGAGMTTESASVFVGTSAGLNCTNGGTTAIGHGSLGVLTSGQTNTAVGHTALAAVVTGDFNTGIGRRAGLGVTGSNNVLIGQDCVLNATSVDETIAIGSEALATLSTGDKNIAIGHDTDVSSGTIASSIAIGYKAILTASNQCVIGSDDAAGNIDDFYLGQGVTKASPGTLTLHGTGASGTDNGAGNFLIAAGQGTGTGVGGDLIFQTATPGSTGSSLNAVATRLTIDDVGLSAFIGSAKVTQSSTSGAVPVITLDQADVDEDYFKFIGTSDTSADRALVDAANFTTPGSIVGWLKINIQDDQSTGPIVDGDYYIPFYAVPTA